MLEGRIGQDSSILSAGALSSLAGLATALMPWLLSGGTLSLHHELDADSFAAQCHADTIDTAVVPGPLVPQMAEAGLFDNDALRSVLGVWRAPERAGTGSAWRHASAKLVDLIAGGSGHNRDNSVQDNGRTPTGNVCAPIFFGPPPPS